MLRFLILAALALASPAAAQTVSGCGTAAIAKASMTNSSKLAAETACFGKARDTAAGAVAVRQAQIAKLTPAPTPRSSTGVPGPIGMNLAAPSYYNSQSPFIDRMRIADSWIVRWTGGGAQAYVDALHLPVDATGLPTSVPAKADSVSTVIQYDDLGTGTTRRYVLLYEGTIWGISGPGVRVVDRQPGRITFTQESFGAQQLNFDNQFDNVHNLHLVREDQLALFNAGKVFNPAFLDRVKLFSPIRFMEWGWTNNSVLTSWSQRLPVTNYSWGIAERSVPLEVMVQLANEAHVEPWFCIPAHADDDYVRQFATYVRDNLDPALRPHIEYSNEVWNGSFEQGQWAVTQGQALFPNEPGWPHQVFYGYRAAQVAGIVRSVLGDRARTVVSVFTWFPEMAASVFQGIAKVGDASKLFDEYAVTTYWGGGLSGNSEKDRATILGWARGGQAGVDAAFDSLNGVPGSIELENHLDTLPGIAGSYVPHAALARQHGLDLVAYEGGFGVVGFAFADADKPAVIALWERMRGDPRMAAGTRRMATDFAAAGGKTLTYFNDVGAWVANGTWGATPNIYATSPILDALGAVNTGDR